MTEVDARGLSCPIPVLRSKKAIEENPSAEIHVLVDTEVARENVSRLAASSGYEVAAEAMEDGYRLLLKPQQ